MPYLVLPDDSVRAVSFCVEADNEQYSAVVQQTLDAMPIGTFVLNDSEVNEELLRYPPECFVWDKDSRQITLKTLEPLWASIRQKRNALLDETDWRVSRERDRVALSKDSHVLEGLIEYREKLRDITKSFKSPFDVKWPAKPWEVSNV